MLYQIGQKEIVERNVGEIPQHKSHKSKYTRQQHWVYCILRPQQNHLCSRNY